ncbi:MAG: segregation/condensation protein A [Planctomycetes bacterium]|nr:segregation/condensation protein A [Planctomycetota bacterium]
MDNQIQIEVFKGPLELLLTLVQSEELSLTRIRLLEVLDQVLDQLRNQSDLNRSGDILVIISTLIELKSRLILPGEVDIGEEIEKLKEDLLEKILVHRRLTEVLDALECREARRLAMHTRPGLKRREEVLVPLEDQDPFLLLTCIRSYLEHARTDPFRVDYELRPIEFYMEWILRTTGRDSFAIADIARSSESLLDLVATLVVLLEWVRLGLLQMEVLDRTNRQVRFSWTEKGLAYDPQQTQEAPQSQPGTGL